ncbi:hypothetical protein [Robiginitalea biformata]|uniref:Lipoprotein n=1 Tax=Robiginitalea biformata (strain ATCC BAA-864 / DSM 15991 / KCTC 12146 / HTCC2501) TaxID=313596 RepID=A4CGA0_ROBBH|nr:hypothetical protein [Robiginitalea biformata]EAR15958.1 hypothetical protein RB2501_03650 [Robiginitalea biformata HTCC2501]
MLRQTSLPGLLAAAVFLLLASGCSKPETGEDATLSAVSAKTKVETLDSQLKQARKAAMRFHSFQQAVKHGYADPYPFNPSPYVPNMGFHYINVGLMDGTFEVDRPEILLYVPNKQGKLKLVGIEYAIPAAPDSEAPEGFIGDEDHWHYNPEVAGGAWTLHAWVVMDNPDGVFASFNPDVPVSDPSLD